MSKIQVEEKQIPFYYLVKSFDVMIVGLELNKYVNVLAKYYDVNDVYLFEKIYFIEGQEYLDWGSNDEYLINLIASKLELVVESQLTQLKSVIEIEGIKYVMM
jgi:hypothetical protein